MKQLIINPGSTSTKISVFEGHQEIFTESIFHDAPLLLSFGYATNNQVRFRKNLIIDFLKRHNMEPADIDVFVGRGGCAYSQKEGVIEIDEHLYNDTKDDKGGSDHPAKLGVMIAYEFGSEFNKPMYTLNPPNVDELIPEARITGIKGVYKRAQSHVLNQKGVARLHAKNTGHKYEKMNYIVCHIDGGITISAHRHGLMIDGTEGAGGDGPFTPTRLGSIPIMETVQYAASHSLEELKSMCSRSGGFVSHFGTSNSDTVHKMKEEGDEQATLIWNTMIYQIAKEVGAMATVLKGKVDAILLTGGLLRFHDIVDGIKKHCEWIAPVFSYQGEVEQEVLNEEVLSVIEGKKKAMIYTGEPVFKGWSWDK